jgi:cytochrome c
MACHGENLEGVAELGAAVLIGGRDSLASGSPKKTVESYWPYASTLFDYVKRAMPFNAPGSLTDDEVYAVSAYILGEANILDKGAVLDANTLAGVEMPNRDGFIPDPRPDIFNYD